MISKEAKLNKILLDKIKSVGAGRSDTHAPKRPFLALSTTKPSDELCRPRVSIFQKP